MSVVIDYSSGAFQANMAQGVGTVTAATGGAYSLANISYDNVSFSVATQEPGPTGIFFKPDGTKMYVCGVTGVVALGFKKVHEYNLSTAWNPYSATYNQSLSVSSQEATPQGIFFKDDGTKMFIVGNTGDAVHEYTLSTAWDISSASFVDSTSTSTQTTNPVSLFFKSDGTKLYIVDLFTSQVLQYNLSTAWDASTMAYSNVSFDLDNSINASSAKEISFNPDGTKMWAIFDGGNRIAEFDLSTAWDVSSASYNSVTGLITISEESTPHALFFKSDGSKLYIVGQTNDTVYQYSTLPNTTIDISSGTYFNYTPSSTTKFVFSNPPASGTAAGFALALTGANVAEVYDIANASYDNQNPSVGTESSVPLGLNASYDGTKFYIADNGSDSINQYTLSTAWDISTISYANKTLSVSSQDTAPQSVAFKLDGTKMFLIGGANDSIYSYSLSTAYDISTASYDSVTFSLATQTTGVSSFFVTSDGTKLFVTGYSTGIALVYQYSLSTAWDLSTISYDSKSFSVYSQETTPRGIALNSNGTKLYILGNQNDSVYQYSLSTAYDISTASYDSVSFNVNTATGRDNQYGILFKPDGTKMYSVSIGDDRIYQYTTGSTSTATFDYPASVDFAGGTAPDGPAIGETDVLVFYTNDGGTTYQGFKAGDAMS